LHFPKHARKGRKFLGRSAEAFSPKLAKLSHWRSRQTERLTFPDRLDTRWRVLCRSVCTRGAHPSRTFKNRLDVALFCACNRRRPWQKKTRSSIRALSPVASENGGDNLQVDVWATRSDLLDDSETILDPVGGRQKSPCRAFALAPPPLWRFGGPGAGRPCDDIVKHTRDGVETLGLAKP
jgi:hypothetical protein